ncbi:MAG: M48 family metalloprotease [Pseudomonadota bacterium]
MPRLHLRTIALLCLLILLAGCAVNPVTGERDLNFQSEAWELAVGQQQYAPLRQQQGGDFNMDADLVAYVRSVGQRLAAVARNDRDLPYEFNVINDSVPNAWALPGGKISNNRGLLTDMESEAELAAVLGHEIVHSAASHGAQQQSRSSLLQGAIIVSGIAVGAATGDEGYTAATLAGGSLGAQLISQSYSRDAERQSDLYGMRYMKQAGYNPRGAVELQETFVRLAEGRQSSSFDLLFASHPPSQERVENNRALLAELGDSGEVGKERYQQIVERLKRAQPAYKTYDEGRTALSDEDYALALQKANQAIAIEPDEALFHGLRGDALSQQSNYTEAERAYSQALRLNESWFYHHLRRGMVRETQGQLHGAREDLQASIDRLATATGYYYLGNVERSAGNTSQAIEHYRVAAQSSSDVGQRAKLALQEMGAN